MSLINSASQKPTARLLQRPSRCSVLTEFAGMLKMPPAQAMLLGTSHLFPAAGGMAWRLQFDGVPVKGRSRACVVLPLAAANLTGEAVVRLLSEQGRLFTEHSLCIGVSPEGWIQFTTVQWHDDAAQLLNTLDRTLMIVSDLLRSLNLSGLQ
jgi:hypothetical protein